MQPATIANVINLYDLSLPGLTRLLAEWGYSAYHAERLWRYLYRQQVHSWADMDDLRPDLRAHLATAATLHVPQTAISVDSSDGYTRKFLLRLSDGQMIETVLMRHDGRNDRDDGRSDRDDDRNDRDRTGRKGRATACISTQAGCAMGCVFCATGQMGFVRHLSPGEIVAQVLHVSRVLQAQGEPLRNIVLMGMGEPLHNYEATMTAVDIMMDHKGLAIAPRHITLSTVGVAPAIKRLADEDRPIHLAVSLHAATDAERAALVPPARRWPLKELIDACRYYSEKRGRRVFFEWTLIEGKNDSPEQAHALGRLLQDLDAHINLIPLNPTLGFAGRPTRAAAVTHFQSILAQYNLPSTVRQRRGIDIAAGCGQLRAGAL
jgi:23S rRNA (adenine2503-C2)-methyltransferase